jgi:hypothetical protein
MHIRQCLPLQIGHNAATFLFHIHLYSSSLQSHTIQRFIGHEAGNWTVFVKKWQSAGLCADVCRGERSGLLWLEAGIRKLWGIRRGFKKGREGKTPCLFRWWGRLTSVTETYRNEDVEEGSGGGWQRIGGFNLYECNGDKSKGKHFTSK